MIPLPPPLRRLAAVLLLAFAVPAVALVTVVPVVDQIRTLRDEIDAERELLGRFRQIASQESEAAALERAGEAAVTSAAYLKGDSEPIKAAGLQRLLADLAAQDRIRLSSTRALESQEREGIRLIGVRVQFHAEIEQVRSLLHRIETARPFLFPEAVQIHPLTAFTQGDSEQNGILDVRFDVFGAVSQKRE